MIATNRFIAYQHYILIIEPIPVDYTNSHSHLGLVLTPSMSWSKHINTCVIKASHRVNLLSRFSLCSLYKTLVRHIIEYCNVIYDNCTMYESMESGKVQKRELGWQPLTVRRKNHKVILLHKIVNRKGPDYLMVILLNRNQCEYNLRSAENATLPTPASRLSSKRFFFASTIRHWNSQSEPIPLCHFKIL